jgi:hypothetical protein
LPPRTAASIPQTDVTWHRMRDKPILELRPRAGVWSPPAIIIEQAEASKLQWVSFGAPSMPAQSPVMIADTLPGEFDGTPIQMRVFRQNQATPTTSMYLHFGSKAKTLMVGILDVASGFTAKYVEQPGKDVQVM